jgi:hypothetical protein
VPCTHRRGASRHAPLSPCLSMPLHRTEGESKKEIAVPLSPWTSKGGLHGRRATHPVPGDEEPVATHRSAHASPQDGGRK